MKRWITLATGGKGRSRVPSFKMTPCFNLYVIFIVARYFPMRRWISWLQSGKAAHVASVGRSRRWLSFPDEAVDNAGYSLERPLTSLLLADPHRWPSFPDEAADPVGYSLERPLTSPLLADPRRWPSFPDEAVDKLATGRKGRSRRL